MDSSINTLDYGAGGTLVKVVKFLHILLIQFKVKDIRILGYSPGIVVFGQRHPIPLERVPNQHLGSGLAVLF